MFVINTGMSARCRRCRLLLGESPALSPKDNKLYVCSVCRKKEEFEVFLRARLDRQNPALIHTNKHFART